MWSDRRRPCDEAEKETLNFIFTKNLRMKEKQVWKGKQEKSIRKAAFIWLFYAIAFKKLFNFKIFFPKNIPLSETLKENWRKKNWNFERLLQKCIRG